MERERVLEREEESEGGQRERILERERGRERGRGLLKEREI